MNKITKLKLLLMSWFNQFKQWIGRNKRNEELDSDSTISVQTNSTIVNANSSTSPIFYYTYTGPPGHTGPVGPQGSQGLSGASWTTSSSPIKLESETLFMYGDGREISIRLLLDIIDTMQKRLLVLSPNIEKNENYPALQEIYNDYKLFEKLIDPIPSNDSV